MIAELCRVRDVARGAFLVTTYPYSASTELPSSY